ncbi:MAG TPA: FHA domain-containing protein, partial [Myxococcota bacterium]|nr:FHA domain-containing protein [Myxococcota bacterium]
MELRLEDLQTEESHTIDAAGATLGRDSRRSSITIPDPGVSGAHARIFARSGRYFIEDTDSSNGTFVEGTRLRGELELKDGIVIALHKYKFRVSVATNGVSAGEATA